MYGFFIVLERIRPVEPHQPFKDIWFNLKWYLIYSLISISIQAIGIYSLVAISQNWLNAPYINIPEPI